MAVSLQTEQIQKNTTILHLLKRTKNVVYILCNRSASKFASRVTLLSQDRNFAVNSVAFGNSLVSAVCMYVFVVKGIYTQGECVEKMSENL